MKGYLLKLLQVLLECIYPARCPLCHDIIRPRGRLLCSKCKKDIKILKEPRCKKCSKAIDTLDEEYCFDCMHTQHYFTEGFAAFPYHRKMQQSMMYFKFHGRKEYGNFYAEVLGHTAVDVLKRWQPDVLMPVPLYKRKQKERGYNQAEVIGRVLSQRFSIPIRTDLIERVRYTKAQKELSNKERRKNLKNAFRVIGEVKEYNSVLMVDDIYTTGSTVDAIAKELKKGGVNHVFFITVCIGSGW